MAMQTCPKCKAKEFTWTMVGESDVEAIWVCGNCKYHAYENETLERICSNCSKKTESKLEEENGSSYWWCSSCNRIT